MNASLRWALVAIALGGGWMLFGERIRPVVESWLAPIEPTEYTRSRGDLDALSAPAAASAPAARRDGPQREHIRDRVRRKVEADLERGARRSDL